MSIRPRLLALLLVGSALAFTSVAEATLISSGFVTLDSTDSPVGRRVARDGPTARSAWAAPKAYPGDFDVCAPGQGAGGTCYYEIVTLDPFPYQDIRITYEWASGVDANIFAVAYLNSVNLSSLGTNYIGDPGVSVGFLFPEPVDFEVVVPSGNLLALSFLSVDSTLFGTVSYRVDGFNPVPTPPPPPAAVPEPGTLLLLGGGLAMGLRVRRRRR